MIDDVVAGFVVLPNRITVPLTNIDPYELKYPLPDVSAVNGVLCMFYVALTSCPSLPLATLLSIMSLYLLK